MIVDPAGGSESVLAAPDGIFIAVALTVLLAYLSVLNAFERECRRLRALVVSVVVPLAVSWIAILAIEALTVFA